MTNKSKRLYVCDYSNCKKKYKTKYSLRRHYLTHAGVRKHGCPYCGKHFILAQYLREHIYIHTGELPFACTYPGCGKKFRQIGKLSMHRKIHTSPCMAENCSQASTKTVETNNQGQAIQFVLKQIEEFNLPDFFFSRELPKPTDNQSSK